MKTNNIIELIKMPSIVIPKILLKYYKVFNLSEKELLFLSLLMNKGEKIIFNVESFSREINYELPEVMLVISSLSDKKVINMSVENGKEYIDFSEFYLKLVNLLIGEEEKSVETNIYEVIENEFGRTLSPIEYETIKGWIDANISDDLIKEALKEAVLNGVNSLKYIDKILYEWNKKGYKKPSDIRRKKDEIKENQIDLFDYDWLDDNE